MLSIISIGGGIHGVSTAYYLSQRGVKSLIIEKSTSSSENDMEDGKNEKLIIAATEALKKDRSDAKDIDQLIE